MRVIYALVPERCQSDVFAYLDEEGIDYVRLSDDGDADDVVLQFPLPTAAVEAVLEELDDLGLAEAYTIVTSAETVETENFERLEEEYDQREDKDIAPAELRTRALEMEQRALIYYTMTLLSALVATSGLLLDAPAIVVGSMVIAPQVGSALKASVGTVFDDRSMIVQGLRSQALGLLLAVVGAAAFGLAIRWVGVGPASMPTLALEQVHHRAAPGVLTVVVGIAAGFAAALSLATAVPTSLVGVMIAAALIPAAAAVGIGLAWGLPSLAAGATVLLVVNTAAINLTGIGGLWALGYRPGDDSRRDVEGPRSGSLRPALAALFVVLVIFAAFGFLTLQHVVFERAATESIEEVLSGQEYDRLTLVTVEARFGRTPLLDGPTRVTVIVDRPPDAAYSDLASTLQRRVSARTDRPVTVAVRFRDSAIARPATAADSNTAHEQSSVVAPTSTTALG